MRTIALALVIGVSVILAPARVSTQSQPFQLDDLARVVRISDPQIAPDGRAIAIGVGHPRLIMSNTGDFRVPISQAYKLYHALKDNNVETKFIAYPVPGHGAADRLRARDVQRRSRE